jgi:hypothetical protein
MPNHCQNRINIHCDTVKQAKEIKDFLHSEETCFDLSKILPEPNYDKVEVLPTFPDIKGNNEPVKKDEAWWDWRVQNWGTKWNTYDDELCYEEDDTTLYYTFDTAWSPPEPVIEALRNIYTEDMGVSISAWFDEPGMEIGGYY